MKYSLEVDSIYKSYDEKIILSDIFLRCEISDIIGVFGRNGSGKSTLLKIIFGSLSAENKFVRINNKVENLPFKAKNGISYSPQDNFIPNYFTVEKAIYLSINKSELTEFYNDEVIIKIFKNKIASLSGGELKYLQIKIILSSNAKFCLLDEPYSGVSPVFVQKINELILKQSKYKGIIIADHSYHNLLEVINKIYLIKDQSGIFLKSKEELIKHGYLKDGML